MSNAAPLPATLLTVSSYLESWLVIRSKEIRPNTVANYRHTLNRYLPPTLRDRALTDVTPLMITREYDKLVRSGGLKGKPLSVSTVKTLHAVLHKAFEDAVRNDLVGTNPFSRARLPKYNSSTGGFQVRFWSLDQLAHFLTLADQDRHARVWRLAVLTGLSRGELLGLTWDRVDFQHRQLHVSMALITQPSGPPLLRPGGRRPRIVAIGDDAATLLNQQRRRRVRALAGDSGQPDFVFTTEAGHAIHPDNLTTAFRKLVKQSGLPPIRFHDLRATQTAALLRAGVPFHLVLKRLGHGDPWLAMKTFGHMIPPTDGEAADVFERLLDP